MADEPMSDERLAEIRRMDSRAEVSMMASSDVAVRDLLAEVERLRAREAATLAIAEAVASVLWTSYCPWCNRHGMMQEIEHYDDCPVLAARALTGITPTEDD